MESTHKNLSPSHAPAAPEPKRPPFAKVEAQRPPFDKDKTFTLTKVPKPDWKPDDGPNDIPIPTRQFETFDPQLTDKHSLYNMILGGVVPRPIAFVSSISEQNIPNLAPLSYFMMASHHPPVCAISVVVKPETYDEKDTAANIHYHKEFVVNIISEQYLEAANYAAIDAPHNVSEWALTGLTPLPSETVCPARVQESPFQMECLLEHSYDIKERNRKEAELILGRVTRIHLREDLLRERGQIAMEGLRPVSQLWGISYGRTTEGAEKPRPSWEEEATRPEVKAVLEKWAQTPHETPSLAVRSDE